MAEAVAGLALGVIPLVLQGYRQIHKHIEEYCSFDRDLRNIRRNIATMEGIFKSIIDTILSEFIEKGRREVILRDLDKGWEQKLGRGLRSELELLFTPMANSIYGAKETVEEIKTILLKLDQRSPFSALADFTRRAFNTTKTDSTQPPADTDRIQSRSRKSRALARGTVAELKTLLDKLREHNDDLLAILHCRKNCKTAPQEAYTYKTLPQVLPCALTTENPVCGASKARPDLKEMQKASKRLYKIVSKTLPCECHTLHLRLEKPTEDKPRPSPVIEPATDFSFLLVARCGGDNEQGPSDTKNPIIPFIFTNSGWESSNSMTEGCGSKRICQELFNSEGGYERYFGDNSGDGKSGFLLRRTATGKVPIINSDPVSLHDLVSSKSKQLEQYDCFQIAANLFYSILPFYSSPWIRHWTPQFIQFFDKRELAASESTPTSWTPHVSLRVNYSDHQFQSLCTTADPTTRVLSTYCGAPGNDQLATENCEIRSLGLMLLELGRKKRLELPNESEGRRIALEKVLIGLTARMGPEYKNIVERCLGRWSEKNMDLMMKENLRDFLSDLSFLEDRAQYYTPETWRKIACRIDC